MYKHNEELIDPRDTNVVSWSPNSRRFIAEASMLEANGISPRPINHLGRKSKMIWLWSEKYSVMLPYRLAATKLDEGDVVAEIYKPYWWVINTEEETLAMMAGDGTELWILND